MAICIDFELIGVEHTVARYRYGECLRELNGIFEIDLYKFTSGELPEDTVMSDVVVLLNQNQSQASAIRAFTKIYRHFKEHGEYPVKGGYYA